MKTLASYWNRQWILTMVSWAATVIIPFGAVAQTITWDGLGDGADWHDGDNWNPAGVPGAGAEVTVAAGATILLTNETAELASFTMTGGTLTFSNWTTRLQSDTVDLQDGTLTLPAAYTNNAMSNRVWIVCQDFTLGEDAAIDADGKGYLGSHGPGHGGGERRGGGSHGGRGGYGDTGTGLPVYGSVHEPILPGSGGCNGSYGGPGGGAVLIQAGGTVDLHGTITARGLDAVSGHTRGGGGGSGGSIFIDCDIFSGGNIAVLDAGGGEGLSHGGGGGGGRIGVSYNGLQGEPAVRFSTASGLGGGSSASSTSDLNERGWFLGSGWGTLSLSDEALITETLDNHRFDHVNLYFRESDVISLNRLTVSNSAVVFATPGLDMTVTGDVLIGANGEWGIGELFGDSNSVLAVGNDMIVTNGGTFSVYSGLAVGTLDGFGARIEVANELAVTDASWIHPYSHSTNGGSARFVLGTLTVAADSGFNAFARGYAGREGDAPGVQGANSSRGTGGSHGGRGGSSDTFRPQSGNIGSLERPVRPGSGGYDTSSYGGGLIYIEVVNAHISGTINANGGSGRDYHLGGGAGGGIVIDSHNLSGQSPLFSADGGRGTSGGRGGGGGGGRIALHYQDVSGLVQPRFRTSPGRPSCHNTSEYSPWQLYSGEGTVWCSTPELLSETIDNQRFVDVRFYAENFDAWTVANLTVSNSVITFAEDGFNLNVTGDVTIGPNGALGIGAVSGAAQPTLTCGGDLTVLADGVLNVFAGSTNGVDSVLGAEVNISGAMIVETGGWVYPYSHEYTAGGGGSPRFRARSLTVAENAGFKAVGRGYRYGNGFTSAGTRCGGGHGGRGGDSIAGSGGAAYGLELAPFRPGSGGGSGASGSGGGVIWLEIATTVELEGTLDTDGSECVGGAGGGGAGGSVLISANDVRSKGGAVLRAVGGDGRTETSGNNTGGGGGGGRIAVWRKVPDQERAMLFEGQPVPRLHDRISDEEEPFNRFSGSFSVDGGASGYGPGEPGTIRFVDGTPTGTVIILR